MTISLPVNILARQAGSAKLVEEVCQKGKELKQALSPEVINYAANL